MFVKMNLFWKSQTMGIPMKYFYMILPFSFALMAARVIQINYMRFVRGEEIKDPDAIDMDEIEASMKTKSAPLKNDNGTVENGMMKKQEKK